jgi:hypothetical protein
MPGCGGWRRGVVGGRSSVFRIADTLGRVGWVLRRRKSGAKTPDWFAAVIGKDGSSVSYDLTKLLKSWPYESGQINVRLIQGDDGEPKVQMRLDLGVLQMEAFGPPTGVRPHGYESLLESFEAMMDEAFFDADGGGEDGDDGPDPAIEDFTIKPEDCRKLREEAVQYYHRYISLLILGEFMGVLRDTTRNLRLVDLLSRHAEREDDRDMLEQFRPYITMMRARAIASQMIADEEPRAAIFFIDRGIAELKGLYEEAGQPEQFASSHEAQILNSMRDELSKKLPSSQRTELRQRLDEAIRNENYELAAILRDELRLLGPDHA